MYTPRLTKPVQPNKYYFSKINKYYATGKYGMPNCVAYAYGRFMEVMNQDSCSLSTGNAEDWYPHRDRYDRNAKIPLEGAIMCWHGVGSKSGHVAVVEKVNSDGTVVTSESAWKGSFWYSKIRRAGSNGNWGMPTNGYRFQGFIYNPKGGEGASPYGLVGSSTPGIQGVKSDVYTLSNLVWTP
jgi:hypothetical protein